MVAVKRLPDGDRLPRICACGDHAFASATQGFVVLVDPDDAHFLAEHLWSAAYMTNSVYVRRRDGDKTQTIHQAIGGPAPVVDHWDGNGLDNRRRNLRPCTQKQNGKNQRRRKGLPASGHRGVDLHRNKFRARIFVDGEHVNLGTFADLESAVLARLNGEARFFGDFSPNANREV